MSTQVYLNPTKLSILSISRDKYWIFASSILRLIHREARRTSSGYNTEVSSGEEGYESGSDDDKFSHESNENKRLTHKNRCNNSSLSLSNEDITDNSSKPIDSDSDNEDDIEDEDEEVENYFFHLAFTPQECTIICSTRLMNLLFKQPLNLCQQLKYHDCKLIDQVFLSIQVDSDGSFYYSERILELTKPLSDNRIPLFFFLTHFNDIVLFPFDLKEKVIDILSQHKFEFSDISNSYILTGVNNEQLDLDINDSDRSLEYVTFDTFKKVGITPIINNKTKLLLTGARSGEINNTLLKTARVLSSFDLIPKYFAITRTSLNEISLILPKSSKIRSSMGFTSKNIIGSTQDVIVPITIDFSKLPLDSTGIVSGVASKLLYGLRESNIQTSFEMNYLSMAQSGIIMIPEENLKIIQSILEDYNELTE